MAPWQLGFLRLRSGLWYLPFRLYNGRQSPDDYMKSSSALPGGDESKPTWPGTPSGVSPCRFFCFPRLTWRRYDRSATGQKPGIMDFGTLPTLTE